MRVEFEKQYLLDLYKRGKISDKKHRFQPEVIKGYVRAIYRLQEANALEDLYKYNSLNYEVLRGDKEGIHSIRVNLQYRIEFTVTVICGEEAITICNIIELSNHYK
ncbi:type II toxin-antitoxin system RelE/ParE family toxin [Bacteroides sp. UBA939]|uniref:type II toxin-antitoxin system RelE/ParE family toxin n=1 Tax=Bacteroides sp. UBA939 TaxID=1946092 RepID=UPI0025C3BB70|nr:type II toxin-antitoxin system RelE/ParE family toxin [Bacteroides sp. UBA939]